MAGQGGRTPWTTGPVSPSGRGPSRTAAHSGWRPGHTLPGTTLPALLAGADLSGFQGSADNGGGAQPGLLFSDSNEIAKGFLLIAYKSYEAPSMLNTGKSLGYKSSCSGGFPSALGRERLPGNKGQRARQMDALPRNGRGCAGDSEHRPAQPPFLLFGGCLECASGYIILI